MTPALAFEHIAHQFDNTTVLHSLSFQVNAGDIFCLLGPSGCGKTTALRIAAGLERPCHGQVAINGQPVANSDVFIEPEARGVGLLFQDYALFPHLSVEQNVLFGLKGLATKEKRQRTQQWLQRLELWDRREAYPHMLSGGEQQRIALARALAPQPAVLLLDEPFSNLDSRLRLQVREEVLTTIKEIDTGTAILLVTHDPEEALYMGDHIAVMESGQILQQGTPAELYSQPKTPSIAAFFGDVNRFQSRVVGGAIPCPVGSWPAGQLADGKEVEVVVRSEGISISDPETSYSDQPGADSTGSEKLGATSNGVTGVNAVIGVITKIRRLGQINRIELICSDGTTQHHVVKVDVLGPAKYRAGDRVMLDINPELVYFYPAIS